MGDFETTIPDFGEDGSDKQNSLFGESIMAQSALASRHSRLLCDTMNTKQIGRLAFNEPADSSNIFGNFYMY